MPLNTLVCRPERIKTVEELDEIISRMNVFKKKCAPDDEIVVLMIQSRQLGAIYRMTSKEWAQERIDNPRICDWGIKFYPMSYFEDLRMKLKSSYGSKN